MLINVKQFAKNVVVPVLFWLTNGRTDGPTDWVVHEKWQGCRPVFRTWSSSPKGVWWRQRQQFRLMDLCSNGMCLWSKPPRHHHYPHQSPPEQLPRCGFPFAARRGQSLNWLKLKLKISIPLEYVPGMDFHLLIISPLLKVQNFGL